jgi:Fe2+ or Zn2+ uptake regulation protein
VVRDIADRTGFEIESHRLELFGRCPDCRTAAAKVEP